MLLLQQTAERGSKLIAGPGVFICDECVDVCRDMIAGDTRWHAGDEVEWVKTSWSAVPPLQTQKDRSTRDDVRAEIEAFATASKGAMARNDLDAVLVGMTDDVVLLTAAGPPVVGRDAVRQMYSSLAGKFHIENTAASADFTVDVVGDVAVVFGKDTAKMTPLNGDPAMLVAGPAVSVFRRVDGTWKLARSLNLMTPVKPE